MTAKPTHLHPAGEVTLKRNTRARRLKLRLTLEGAVEITLPPGVSKTRALAFAAENSHWIAFQREKLRQQRLAHQALSRSHRVFSSPESAAHFLKERLGLLAERHGFTFKRVTVRNQQTRWGSCSVKDHISLNIKLACLPDAFVDYVLLHELVHTRHRHHGPAFWRALHGLEPRGASLRLKLSEYRPAWLAVPGFPPEPIGTP